jgi:nucleoside-diphosphate-sugar epimerase
MEKYKVLITGGHGFIGCYIANNLNAKGHTVGVIDNYTDYKCYDKKEYKRVIKQRILHANAATFVGNIFNSEDTFKFFQPDIVIHLASCPNARMLLRNVEQETKTAVDGMLKILQLCVKYKVKRIVFASSSMVYGDFMSDAPNELHLTNPKTLYGSYKLAGEQMIKTFNKDYGLEYCILRPSAIYGTRDMIIRVISQMAKSMFEKGEITITGDKSKLDFTYVTEVAEAFVQGALHKGATNMIFNCSRGRGRSIVEAANLVKDYMGNKCKLNIKESDSFYPSRDTLNSTRLKILTGWKPKIDIEEGIKKYVEWFKENYIL